MFLPYAEYHDGRVLAADFVGTFAHASLGGWAVQEASDGGLKILLAEEQSLFREAVKVALSSQDDFLVVSEARDGLQAVSEADRTRPNVALVDAYLPNCDGVRATRLIKEAVPECRVLLLLANEEDHRTVVKGLEAGASGFVTKEAPLSELIDAARAIHRGETLVPPQMLGALLSQLIQRRREQDGAIRRMARLTRREREVLARLAEGADSDGIAQILVISPETARTHIQNVLSKLGVHSRLEATAFVIHNGLLDELQAVDG
jgi:DNA-binding NarL/FixJ family response regulator